jgi:hypothetical protein
VALFIPTQIFAQSGIVATPSDLNIGSFCPGETGSGVVTLTNPDDNPSSVTITGYEFVAGGWGDFSLQDPSSILVTLEPGGSVVATVLFTPAYDTTYVMTLLFYRIPTDRISGPVPGKKMESSATATANAPLANSAAWIRKTPTEMARGTHVTPLM